MIKYVIDRTCTPPTCFPVDLDTEDLVEVTVIGAQWATFRHLVTGITHDCALYYRQSLPTTVYRCLYEYLDFNTIHTKSIIVPFISAVKDGFWVDKEGKYTLRDNCYEWIPPSRIYLVRKEETE